MGEIEKADYHQQQRKGNGRRWSGLRSGDNMAGQAREIVLDGEIAVSDDRGVTHIDDLQDAFAGRRPETVVARSSISAETWLASYPLELMSWRSRATGTLPQNINFAIKSAIIREFLDAHRVDYLTSQSVTKIDPADVGEMATRSTVMLECYK
jgi:hypothetical protein